MHIPLLGDVSDVLLLVLLLLLAFYFYGTSYVGVWEKVGVPGPKPWPFIDHSPELKEGLGKAFDQWQEKYGRSFGMYSYSPRTATFVTTDLRIVNEIMIKDFSNFVDRHSLRITHSSVFDGLFFLNGESWKRVRHVMSPMFTGGKLRLMMNHSNESAAALVNLLKETKANDELIPVKTVAAKYLSDIIAKIGFGVNGHALTKEDSQFFVNINRYFRTGTIPIKIFRIIAMLFTAVIGPVLKLFPSMDVISPEAEEYFVSLVNSAIEKKKRDKLLGEGSKTTKDMLDLLLDAEVEEDKPFSGESRAITRKEIIGNSTLLIFAAYDTTSSALSAILYCLARHPDVQKKLIEEIDEAMNGRTEPDYECLSQLKYMEQVINESIRLFPPVGIIQRRPRETRTYHGMTIPRGTNVLVPSFKIMTDPEYWEDPQKFDPDRFSDARKSDINPAAFLPFGIGPRQCIGKRLALINLKVALCHLLSAMKFMQTDQTEPKLGQDVVLIPIQGTEFMVPSKPVVLDIVLRNK